MLQATRRLVIVDSESKEFDVYLKYCSPPFGADFYQHDPVGTYGSILIGNYVAIRLKDGRSAYTESKNVV